MDFVGTVLLPICPAGGNQHIRITEKALDSPQERYLHGLCTFIKNKKHATLKSDVYNKLIL